MHRTRRCRPEPYEARYSSHVSCDPPDADNLSDLTVEVAVQKPGTRLLTRAGLI